MPLDFQVFGSSTTPKLIILAQSVGLTTLIDRSMRQVRGLPAHFKLISHDKHATIWHTFFEYKAKCVTSRGSTDCAHGWFDGGLLPRKISGWAWFVDKNYVWRSVRLLGVCFFPSFERMKLQTNLPLFLPKASISPFDFLKFGFGMFNDLAISSMCGA